MKTYDIKIYRDGRWWMVEIPELDGLTQARRVTDADQEAIDYIAVTTDVAQSQVAVNVVSLVVDGVDLLAQERAIEELRTQSRQLEEELSAKMREVAKSMAMHQVPVRDIGEVLHVSYQRAHQLANA